MIVKRYLEDYSETFDYKDEILSNQISIDEIISGNKENTKTILNIVFETLYNYENFLPQGIKYKPVDENGFQFFYLSPRTDYLELKLLDSAFSIMDNIREAMTGDNMDTLRRYLQMQINIINTLISWADQKTKEQEED